MIPIEEPINFHKLYYRGQEDPVIDSSRVRLARNLAGHSFVSRLDIENRRALLGKISADVMKNLGKGYRLLTRDNTNPEARSLLEELNIIPEKFFEPDGYRGLVFGADIVSIMINEEDHIRIQAFAEGKALQELYRKALIMDEVVEKAVGELAFSKRWGYLTACITNVGTGLRCSVMMHLPALTLTKQIPKLSNASRALGYTIRGPHGEGSDPEGNLYQLSNQRTLGLSEQEIITGVENLALKISGFEEQCRKELLKAMKNVMEDKVYRAMGIVTSARMISSREAYGLLSAIRLGLEWDFLSGKPRIPIRELNDQIKPAHLGRIYGEKLQGEDNAQRRDILRAEYLRKTLTNIKTRLSN